MSHIFVIQNIGNKGVLTRSLSSSLVTTHQSTNDANNFHVKLLGVSDRYHIQRYNNQSDKLQPATGGSEVCHQAIPTSSTPTVWVAERRPGGDSLTGIKLCSTNSSGTKWYLRVKALGGEADLVCPAHFNHDDYDENELKFNLISVNVSTL